MQQPSSKSFHLPHLLLEVIFPDKTFHSVYRDDPPQMGDCCYPLYGILSMHLTKPDFHRFSGPPISSASLHLQRDLLASYYIGDIPPIMDSSCFCVSARLHQTGSQQQRSPFHFRSSAPPSSIVEKGNDQSIFFLFRLAAISDREEPSC